MKVVILCGGKGTRSYPFTEYFPKPMMPICGTPIIVHLMRIYSQQGFSQFVLSAGHRKEILEDYFNGRFSNWDITIVDTGSDADTGDRISRCADYVGDTFFATYGDGLGDLDLGALLRFHQASNGLATVTSVPLRSQYGTLVFNSNGQVREFREKPMIRDYWINAGFFVFDKRAFDHWHGHNLESDVLPALSARNQLYSYTHEGFWKSMDTSKDQQELERLYAAGAPWVISQQPAIATPATIDLRTTVDNRRSGADRRLQNTGRVDGERRQGFERRAAPRPMTKNQQSNFTQTARPDDHGRRTPVILGA